MRNFKQIDSIKKDEKSIIDKSNLDQNLFIQDVFLNYKNLNEVYKNKYLGFPILLNKNESCFQNKKNFFKIQ